MVATHKVSAAERQHMVAEAAYFLAENRGSDGGDPVADWLEAEAEVNARLGETQRLEERLEAVNRKLKTARRKLSSMTADVRQEWERDIEKLAKLRDEFQEKLGELRRQGTQASEKARQQLESAWDEAAELLHRLERSRKKQRKG